MIPFPDWTDSCLEREIFAELHFPGATFVLQRSMMQGDSCNYRTMSYAGNYQQNKTAREEQRDYSSSASLDDDNMTFIIARMFVH